MFPDKETWNAWSLKVSVRLMLPGLNSSCNLCLHSVACLHMDMDKHYNMFIFPITYCFVKVHCTHSRPLPNGFRLGLCQYSLVFLVNRVILAELEVCSPVA